MKLVDIYHTPEAARILYRLLEEREPTVNIGHRRMPTWDEHLAFIKSNPYSAWYLIEDTEKFIGAAYLTKANEIGTFIFRAEQGAGFGPRAIRLLMDRHPRPRYLANINPLNERSTRMFERLGFHHIQNTYELLKDVGT